MMSMARGKVSEDTARLALAEGMIKVRERGARKMIRAQTGPTEASSEQRQNSGDPPKA
jgi:hypothetical protein